MHTASGQVPFASDWPTDVMYFLSIYQTDMHAALGVMVGQQVDLLVNIDQSPFPIPLIGRK